VRRDLSNKRIFFWS